MVVLSRAVLLFALLLTALAPAPVAVAQLDLPVLGDVAEHPCNPPYDPPILPNCIMSWVAWLSTIPTMDVKQYVCDEVLHRPCR